MAKRAARNMRDCPGNEPRSESIESVPSRACSGSHDLPSYSPAPSRAAVRSSTAAAASCTFNNLQPGRRLCPAHARRVPSLREHLIGIRSRDCVPLVTRPGAAVSTRISYPRMQKPQQRRRGLVAESAYRPGRPALTGRWPSASSPQPSLLRICGNRITSLMDGLSVSTITSRSIPTPSPAVGGRPYSSART
jgi:hypothetical protein